MPAKLTHEVVKEKYFNKGIELLSTYVDRSTKNKLRCLKLECRYEWESSIKILYQGCGCPACGGSRVITTEYARSQYLKADISLESEFKKAKSKNKLRCLKPGCSHKWEGAWSDFKTRGAGCPKCANNIKHSHEHVKGQYLLSDISLLSDYVNANTKNSLKCLKPGCGNEWESDWDCFTRGQGCPSCADYGFNTSKPSRLYTLKTTLPKNGTNVYKIGITQTDVKDRIRRMKGSLPVEVVTVVEFSTGQEAIDLEKQLHESCKNFQVTYLQKITQAGLFKFSYWIVHRSMRRQSYSGTVW